MDPMHRRRFLANALHTMALGAAGLSLPGAVGRVEAAPAAADWSLLVADVEGDIAPETLIRLHGQPPPELAGTLFRNGPAKFRRPGGNSGHWFDGDGLVRAFELRDGTATLQARFVGTEKRQIETEAGAMIMAGFGTPQKPGTKIANSDQANAANTSVIQVGNELWALWEAGSATRMDPATLTTIGPKTFSPDLKSVPFLAHPRFERDGRIWNLGLAGDRAIIWRIEADGTLQSADIIHLPRASYIHDFTMTDTHLILVLQPWIEDHVATPETAGFVWRPEQGTRVLVIDKADFSIQRSFDLPPFFCFHMSSAWAEAEGTIRFDACIYDDAAFAIIGGQQLLQGIKPKNSEAQLAMITLRPDGRATLQRVGVAAEFPRSDPRFSYRQRRYTVHLDRPNADMPMFRGIGIQDWHSGAHQLFDMGPGQIVEEMVFTPRPGSASELDGWLVGTSLNLNAGATELHVFNASRIAEGPICSWRASRSLPVGFHGSFIRI
jgi:carotenoid cleavage dioxygenase-like enzyme